HVPSLGVGWRTFYYRTAARPGIFRGRLRHEMRLDRGTQLVGGERPFELRLDLPVAADEEHPGLALESPLLHPAVVAARRVVVVVHLDVDEVDARPRELLANVGDDIDDGTARPARAELGRGERDDERTVRGELLRDGVRVERAVRMRGRCQRRERAAR